MTDAPAVTCGASTAVLVGATQPEPAAVSVASFDARVLRAPGATRSRRYISALGLAFTFFSSVRLVSYLPALWAIWSSGESSQHSLWTWGTWFGSNLTMAMWLYEQNGQRLSRAVVVNGVNATMCAVTFALILVFRISPAP